MRSLYIAFIVFAAAQVEAGTLEETINKVWERRRLAQTQISRIETFQVREIATNALLPEAPVIAVSYSGDDFTERDGKLEWEAELGVPLWLPQEKTTNHRLLTAERINFDAEQQLARWQIAGEVHQAISSIQLAVHQHERSLERLSADRELENDVIRRVNAGELASTDVLLIQAEIQSAIGELARAEADVETARQTFINLVGDADVPHEKVVLPTHVDASQHPLLLAAQSASELAQSRFQATQMVTRERPELTIGATRSRDDTTDPFRHQIKFTFKLPLAANFAYAPRQTESNANFVEASSEIQTRKSQVDMEIATARIELNAANKQLTAAERSAALSMERLQLSRSAFALGDKGLEALLRAQIAAHEANYTVGQLKIKVLRARILLNHAQGAIL